MYQSDNSAETLRYRKFMGLRPGQTFYKKMKGDHRWVEHRVDGYPHFVRQGPAVKTDKGEVLLTNEVALTMDEVLRELE